MVSLEAARAVPNPEFECRLSELEGLCVEPIRGASSQDLEVECRLFALEPIRDDRDGCVSALKQAVSDLGCWRPKSEGLIDDLRQQVSRLATERDRQVFDTSLFATTRDRQVLNTTSH